MNRFHPGMICGYRGTRAVVLDVRAGSRCDRVRINWAETLPVRECAPCLGTGRFSRQLDYRDCPACRGRGELPSEIVNRSAWIDTDDLTEPPEREMPPGGEDVAAVLAAMGEGS